MRRDFPTKKNICCTSLNFSIFVLARKKEMITKEGDEEEDAGTDSVLACRRNLFSCI